MSTREITDPLRVGIVGASPEGGWAATAHLPAVQALDAVELVAVATSRRESAERARDLYGARRGYADGGELIADPDVEAVVVAVKVPDHEQLVAAALAAGKHVYCEWPLTTETASAIELRETASRAGLETIVGLQTARSQAIRHAAELARSGELGELLSVTLLNTTGIGGPTAPRKGVYMSDAANGANLLTITAGHALDTLCAVAGEPVELSATVASHFPEVTIAETGERVPATSPDQISLTGTLDSGAVMTVAVQGGHRYESGFRLEVRGSGGGLFVTARPSLSSARLTIERTDADGERIAVTPPAAPAALAQLPAGPPSFVGVLYLDLATAVRHGQRDGPDFAHAVRRHQLLDTIRAAAAQGERQRPAVGSG